MILGSQALCFFAEFLRQSFKMVLKKIKHFKTWNGP
jgi:hypothetical protein